METGAVDESTYELVVDDMVGFDNGSLYFFGDFMYYATPSADVNYKGDVLYYKTKFMRYDLVNKKSYTLYTTKQNSESESISYAYYIVGDSLNLVVYEADNYSVTSLKIGKETTTNYVIDNVTSCVMSENFGKCVTENKTVDANSYVYYTLSHDSYEAIQTGVKVYRTSPVSNNSVLLSDDGKDVALLCVRNGKLLYSVNDIIYAHEITGTESEKISFDFGDIISYQTYENVIFMENADGSISLLSYNKDTYQLVVCKWENGVDIQNHTVNVLSKAENFEFVTLATIDEVVVEDKEDTDEDETKTEKVQFLIYIHDGAIYKIEIARENSSGDMVLSKYTEPVKLTTTTVQSSSGLIVPEVIGNYLFIYAQDDSKNVYMFKADISIKETSTKKATFVGVKE